MTELHRFSPEHLDAVTRLALSEGWTSLAMERERALRSLQAPGVITVVAIESGEVVGFAQLLSDGEIQAYLAQLAVERRYRSRGIGTALVERALDLAGGERVDLLSEDGASAFYESFPHKRKPGFRLYPARR